MSPIKEATECPSSKDDARHGPELLLLNPDFFFGALLEHTPDGICVSTLDSHILYVNGPLCRMLGYSAEQLNGVSLTSLSHPGDPGFSAQNMEQLFAESERHTEIENRLIHRDGHVVWTAMNIARAPDGGDKQRYFMAHIRNITDGKRADAEMRDSEERFRIIADSCPSMMWATGDDGVIQYMNEASWTFFGVASEPTGGLRWRSMIHPEDASGFVETLNGAIANRAPFMFEAQFRRADGEWRLLDLNARPRLSSGGEYLGHIGVGTDITERNRAEQTRQFELSLMRSIFDETLEGILVVDDAGVIVASNLRFLKVWGFDGSEASGQLPETIVGIPSEKLMPASLDRVEDSELFKERVQELRGHRDKREHCEFRLKDGRTLERRSAGMRTQAGKYLGRVWFLRDITGQKTAESDLRRAMEAADEANRRLLAEHENLDTERRMLRALIDNIPDFMYVKDVESRFVVANLHVTGVVGAKTPDELLGKTDFDFFPIEEATGFYEDEQKVIRSGVPLYNREEKGTDSTGNEVHILTTKVPVRDNTGRIIGIAGVGRNITSRKKMENALQEAERKYRGIFDNAIFAIFQSTPEGRFLSVNSTMAVTHGYHSPVEMITSISNISRQYYVDPERRKIFMHLLDEAGAAQNFECEVLRKDGGKIWVAMSARAIRENGVVVCYEGMCEDITERKKMEDALREAEQKYRGIFDKSIVGIYQSTPDGSFLSVNPSMAFTFGYDSPDEMIASVTDMSRQFFVSPKRGVEFMLIMDRVGGVKNFECEVYCKDHSKIWITMSIRAIRQNGEVIRYEGMCEDITERILLREQLLQAQKLESVGQLAAGIAHEINTPTQYIGDNVRFLKEAFQDLKNLLMNYERLLSAARENALSGETVKEVGEAVERADAGYLLEEIPKAIDQSLEGVTRVAALVNAMKEFSHPGSKEKILTDLNHAIESTIAVSRNEWKYVADMETDFAPSLPPVLCLVGAFNQVILNLIVNAAHAIADATVKGGPAKGKIKMQTLDCLEWVEIRIQDTGTGIPEKVRPRIFDPFFTTKEIGKGTGQGLAIARSVVVDQHGGSIHFETEEGKGTTFIIRLPRNGNALNTKAVVA